MKKWGTVAKLKTENSKFKIDEVVKILLQNRGIETKKETEDFLNPKLSGVTIRNVKISAPQVKKSVDRIKKAIKNKEQVVIFGDYDVDGICGSAILWETLNDLGVKVMPYIPNRIDEGYGLSIIGIKNLKSKIQNIKLIITVDNGIVANKAVEFAKKQGIDVIITDHHVPSKKLPKAFSIVHTTLLCGTGVAYMLANSLWQIANSKKTIRHAPYATDHLGLVALATVSDLVPLLGANRTLLKYGLLELHETKRPGLLALFKEAQINQNSIGVYEIGHMIAPRLNAMGRLESAMDSLRLVCTTNKERATKLAHKLGFTNRERQAVTEEAVAHAKAKVRASKFETEKLLFISDKSYEQGVIGLVAGRLVEEFYIPSIVISKGEIYSKASARSVSGFNIIEFIRSETELLVDVGGHPMAAGFMIETSKLLLLEKNLKQRARKLLSEGMLKRSLKIDMELSASSLTQTLYDAIQKLQPFGMKNPEPTFLTKNLVIGDLRLVGNSSKHLKLNLKSQISNLKFEGIAFGMGEENGFKIGDSVDAVYTIDENEWNGNKNLQLKIKDLRKN
jgi:single-stranded-DNA-specific exonuclease